MQLKRISFFIRGFPLGHLASISAKRFTLDFLSWKQEELIMAQQPLTISPAGIELIKHYQGLNLEQYQDESGLWVIGYGHMIACYENFAGPLTPETAEALLLLDIQRCQCLLQQCMEISLNQPQYDAMVSLALSCGNEAFYQSAIVKHINRKEFDEALAEWKNAIVLNGKTISSLTSQRQAECALFLQGGEVEQI